jgi:DDE family transposase
MAWEDHAMELHWYRRNQEAVAQALEAGAHPDMATTMASGPLDELVALHDELGVFAALDALDPRRQRKGIDDRLLLRTLSVMPFLECHSFTGAAELLFHNPAILLHLGWSPFQIRMGDSERHRSSHGRQRESLPCHPETLRDELSRISEADWLTVQQQMVAEIVRRGLVRGGVFAIDGSGFGNHLRLVSLTCVSTQRPIKVAWRLLEGDASEKGKEAAVTRSLLEQAQALGIEIELLLVDALYADGPFLARCKYEMGIEVLVPIPSDRELHHDLEQLAQGGLLAFQRYSYVRTIQGHKQRRTLDLGAQSGLTSWDSFLQAAKAYGEPSPALWGCLIRPVEPTSKDDLPWTLVSTRKWVSGVAGFEAFRPRWHIENGEFRELKEGWGLEEERWGRNLDVQRGRITLTCLAFNTAQIYLSEHGPDLAAHGIRRIRRLYDDQLGHSPVVIYLGRYYAVFPVEELLRLIGRTARQSLRPAVAPRSRASPRGP